MRKLRLGLGLGVAVASMALALGACAAGESETGGDREQIVDAFESVSAAVRSGDPDRVCAELGPMAREQVDLTGRGPDGDCGGRMLELLESMRAAQHEDGGAIPRSSIASMKLKQSATVVVDVGGRTVKVPFVKEGSDWKLDSFYGLEPTRSRALQ